MTAKDRIVDIMRDLPDDATIEDALYELYVALKIERGLEQADKGEGILHEEAKQRFAEWLK
jgi:predicted transcriptional regulator